MELLDVIIITGVAVTIGMWAGWNARWLVMMAMFSENPEKIIEILQKIKKINDEENLTAKVVKAVGVEVEPELVNGVWYAYSKENNQFVGQGPTIEAALEQAKLRFPGKSFWCNRPKEPSQTA